VVFSEMMTESTINSTTYTLKQGTTTVNGSFNILKCNINNTAVTYASFIPSSYLEYLKPYTVTISSSVKDLAGNTIGSDYSWSFTTEMNPDQELPIPRIP
jgi:uncharacterized protein YfaS (alpha-2-macroglobulin family)